MCRKFLREVILTSIAERGRAEGAPTVIFTDREISVEGDELKVGMKRYEWWLAISWFYHSLPHNAYGVVSHPNGRLENMPGGLHEAPAGLYRVFYVDKQERSAVSSPVSEITTDGEKLALKIIVRYQVDDPVVALAITNPVDTMMEHIETDVAQYIRTHKHTEIADSAIEQDSDSRLLSFFTERHSRREPLAKALKILGVELKEFMGDKEFVDMRRRVGMDERLIENGKKLEELQQELAKLKARHKADNEKLEAEHKAEKEKIEAHHEKEMQDILHDVNLRKIELDDKAKRMQRREEEFLRAIDAISSSFSSGYPTNPTVISTMTDLVAALKEEIVVGTKSGSAAGKENAASNNRPTKPQAASESADKVEKLTQTLLDLLKSKK